MISRLISVTSFWLPLLVISIDSFIDISKKTIAVQLQDFRYTFNFS